MSVDKVFRCDICGEIRQRGELVRLGARLMDERPEDADNVDVCGDCQVRPIAEVVGVMASMRAEVMIGGS